MAARRRSPPGKAERFVMDRVCWFFGRGAAIFAPNPDLAAMLRERSGKPVFPMGRGIDTQLFHPTRRRARMRMVLGFVGRLMPEKNLRLLPQVAAALRYAGIERFRFQITGAGSERAWLERNLPNAVFTGVLSRRSPGARLCQRGYLPSSLREPTRSATWCRRRSLPGSRPWS